jgi:hypothetical protein
MINDNLPTGSLGLRAAVRRHPATAFVLLTFALSWSVWVPERWSSKVY